MDKRAREGSQSRSTSSSIIALICMIVAGCNFYSSSFADAKIIELTVANINGDVILLSDLDNKVRRLNRVRGNQLKISATRKEALDTIIRENLVERYAAEIGISVSDEDLNSSIEQIIASEGKSKKEFIKSLKDSNLDFTEFQDQIRYNMLTNRVFGFEIKRPVISDEKAKEYYLANRDKFKSKRKIQFSHIITVLPKDGDESSSKRAQERIREALAELESGAKFADVASKYSEDKSALTGGLVGWIEEGTLVPEIDKPLFSLNRYARSNIIKSRFGFHIIKAGDIKESAAIPYSEASTMAKTVLENIGYQQRKEEWFEKVKSNSHIEILHTDSIFD